MTASGAMAKAFRIAVARPTPFSVWISSWWFSWMISLQPYRCSSSGRISWKLSLLSWPSQPWCQPPTSSLFLVPFLTASTGANFAAAFLTRLTTVSAAECASRVAPLTTKSPLFRRGLASAGPSSARPASSRYPLEPSTIRLSLANSRWLQCAKSAYVAVERAYAPIRGRPPRESRRPTFEI